MKKIVLDRCDLVWESYRTEWDAEDWDKYVKWLAGRVETFKGKDDSWSLYHLDLYNLIKDLTWDDVIADFNKFEENYKNEDCLYILRHNSFTKEDGSCEEWSYKDFLHDIIKEVMQEELYNNEPYDTEYADDYNESISVEDE